MSAHPRFYDERIETMPRDQLLAIQEARALAMIDFAYARVPLIRHLWEDAGITPADIRSLADLTTKAPFMDKDDIRRFRDRFDDPCGGMMGVDPAELKLVGTTSGTTGDPTPILLGPRSPLHTGYMRDMWGIGCRPGDYIARPLFTFRGATRPDFHDTGWIPIQFSHNAAEVPRIFEASRRFRPTAAFVVSSPLLTAMEQELERTGEDPTDIFKSYRGGIFGGEGLSDRQRKLAMSWGLELFELGPVGDVISGQECTAHAGIHAWEDMVFMECLDPATDLPVADGEVGELVVTGLTDRFNPLIRCRTDDMVRIDRAPCACGRTHARLQVVGRKSDRLGVGDRTIMPREVQALIQAQHATRAGLFQFVRPVDVMDHLHLRVGYEALLLGTKNTASLVSDLTETIAAALEVPVKVELTPIEELLKLGPPHKIPRVTKI